MTLDWKNPDYSAVQAERIERLVWLRAHPEALPALKAHYAAYPEMFLTDWGTTFDPRNKERSRSVEIPFILFPRQVEFVQFLMGCMRTREPGIVVKSRDCGASWLALCTVATLCLFTRGFVGLFGSAKESKIDDAGDPNSLFWKVRYFLRSLPPEFLGNWNEAKHSAHLRIVFPDTNSALIGEAGTNIGRGGRSTIAVLDESAFIERPELIDASLAGNSDCVVHVSTPNGPNNSFAEKYRGGKIKSFVFSWREDPRKDDVWYQDQCKRLDEITRRQEIDLDFNARSEGVLVPAEWVQAAIGAHTKLGIEVTGARRGALDVADEGRDLNCFAGRRGILLEHLHSWSGKGSDIYQTVVKAFGLCEQHGYGGFDYDADGVGAGVRGDAANLNAQRAQAGKSAVETEPFRGSAGVFAPEGSMVEGRLNKDYFANLKAQSWWALRLRFQATYRAVIEGMPYDPDALISIDPSLPELTQLTTELSQPSYDINQVGKIIINKMPDGTRSPNLADATMIAYAVRAGAYFSARAAESSAATDAVPAYPVPRLVDYTFGLISFVEDTGAVVFCAKRRDGAIRPSEPELHVLDYDVARLDADTESWVHRVLERLDALHALVNLRGKPPKLLVDAAAVDTSGRLDEGFAELLRQRRLPLTPISRHLPARPERFGLARPYVKTGRVGITSLARERLVCLQGATRNYLLELLAAQTVPESNALAIAFATAVLLTYMNRPDLPAVPPEAPRDAVQSEPPRPAPRPALWMPALLSAGAHKIQHPDGHIEQVVMSEGGYWQPPTPGRFTIDGTTHWASPVGSVRVL